MSFEDVISEWLKGWRKPQGFAKRYKADFGHWPDDKLRELLEEADREFSNCPTPNQLKRFAAETGIWEERRETRHEPRGCPLCGYTGFVSVEDPEGYVVAATCMCEKGQYLQRVSESFPLEDGKKYPRTPVSKLMHREGYRPQWQATCEDCQHYDFDREVCTLEEISKKPESMACQRFKRK